jgi:hypothetical protein
MLTDTTDSDWDDDRDRRGAEGLPEPAPQLEPPPQPRPAPQPEPGSFARRAATSSAAPPPSFNEPSQSATGTYYPGFGHVEEEDAATVRYSSFDDHDSGYAHGDYEEPPPTEEVPSAVLQDVSQAYNAPMNVPEPPPIPGILDRFTPVGAPNRGAVEPRPSYLADTPPPPLETDRRMPRPQPRTPPEESRRRSLLPLLLGALVFLVGAGALVLLLVFLSAPGSEPVVPPTPAGVEPVQPDDGDAVEGRGGVKVKVQQGLRSDDDPPEPSPEPEPAPEPEPEPVAPNRTAPAPPPPRPAPPPVTAPAVQSLGTISIRSNRKALIYMDGAAIGLTPKSIKAAVGTRSISAMLPGQPQSKQTKSVDVVGGKTKPVSFTF